MIWHFSSGTKEIKATEIRSKSLVNILSVTTEILLIRTNVARTYVACHSNSWHIFFGSNKISGLKTLGPNKILCLEMFCPRTFWSTKIMPPKRLGPKSLVKIGLVTAEILLIWTNVTRAYDARTNVTITVGIFLTWSKDLTFKVWWKSDQ